MQNSITNEKNVAEQINLYNRIFSDKQLIDAYKKHMQSRFFEVFDEDYFFKILFGEIGNRVNIKLLDLGSGGGKVSLMAGGKVDRICNLDVSFNALRYVKTRAATNKDDYYVQGSAANLPFQDNLFDIVTGYCLLHHIEDLDNSMREISRVLKIGGVFLCCEINERYTWVDFWLGFLKIPGFMSAHLKKAYLWFSRYLSKKDWNIMLLEKTKGSIDKFIRSPEGYQGVLKKYNLKYETGTVPIEILPPRFFTSHSKFTVKLIFKLSSLLSRLSDDKNNGRLILIKAYK